MKRKAFISYSMKDSEQYVLTLLSNLLREEGFQIDSSFDSLDYGTSIANTIRRKISDSTLFIGVITQTGRNKHVLDEWKQAGILRIPSLLLVEDTVPIQNSLGNQQNVLRFNRHYPEEALEKATGKIRKAQGRKTNQESDNVVGWVLGGLAILALIKLLSNDE